MGREVRFTGRFTRLNEAMLREKASKTNDPRARFYRAMIEANTYEQYYEFAGQESAQPATYRNRPVTAHMEIRYVRNDRKWIEDC